jgi:hypothetical protein
MNNIHFYNFRWDFQWINEVSQADLSYDFIFFQSIQLNSPRLPQETRAFFEVICPQCFFIVSFCFNSNFLINIFLFKFNISADGLPSVQIRADKSILIRKSVQFAGFTLIFRFSAETALPPPFLIQLWAKEARSELQSTCPCNCSCDWCQTFRREFSVRTWS